MKTLNRSLLLTLLAVALTLVLITAASAGAVFKRDSSGSTGSSASSSTSARPADRPAERPSSGSSQSRSTYQPRQDRVTRPIEPMSPTGTVGGAFSHDKSWNDRMPATGNVGASSVITPTYKRTDTTTWTNRSYDSRASETRGWNDYKYHRLQERRDYVAPRSYYGPRYSGGYYYYGSAWPYDYEFPCSYGYWVFGDNITYVRRSAYFYYGYFPYIPSDRVIIISRPVVTYVEVPIVVRYTSNYGGYYLERPQSDPVGSALSDIRLAWINRDPNLLSEHLRSDKRVDVLLDGSYSYTLDSDDYSRMTRDAILATDTVSFQFDTVRKRGDSEVVAYGRHEFYGKDGDRKMVYVSYLLEKRGSDWVIIEVGSSNRRLDA